MLFCQVGEQQDHLRVGSQHHQSPVTHHQSVQSAVQSGQHPVLKAAPPHTQQENIDLSDLDARQAVPILFNDDSFDSLVQRGTILEPISSAVYFKISLITKTGQIIKAIWDSGARSSIFLEKYLKDQRFITNKLLTTTCMEVVGGQKKDTNVYQVLLKSREGLPYSHVSCAALSIKKIISPTKNYNLSHTMNEAYLDYVSLCSKNGEKPINKAEWPTGHDSDYHVEALLGVNSLTFRIIHVFKGLIFIVHNLDSVSQVSVGGQLQRCGATNTDDSLDPHQSMCVAETSPSLLEDLPALPRPNVEISDEFLGELPPGQCEDQERATPPIPLPSTPSMVKQEVSADSIIEILEEMKESFNNDDDTRPDSPTPLMIENVMTMEKEEFEAAEYSDFNLFCDTQGAETEVVMDPEGAHTSPPHVVEPSLTTSPLSTASPCRASQILEPSNAKETSSSERSVLDLGASTRIAEEEGLSAPSIAWMKVVKKDRDEAIRSQMSRVYGGIWKCDFPNCDYASSKSTNVYNHVESQHMPDHDGYKCDHCIKVFQTRHSLINHTNKAHKKYKVQPIDSFMENLHFSDETSPPHVQDLSFQMKKPGESASHRHQQDLSLQMKKSSAVATSSMAPSNEHGTPQESNADVITCCPVCGKQNKVNRFGSITLCQACHNFARSQVEKPKVLDCLSGYENTEMVGPCTLRANRQMCKVCRYKRILQLGWTVKSVMVQRWYRCTECPTLSFDNKKLLLDHIEGHQDIRLPCQAPHCDKSYLTKRTLDAHTRFAHPTCRYPLCKGGVKDHNHLGGLRYSCRHSMSPEEVKICDAALPQPGATFFCPDHFGPLILTEHGRPLKPGECLDVQMWFKTSKMWKKIPFCNMK